MTPKVQQLVEQNMHLAWWVAGQRHTARSILGQDETRQVAMVGLMKAAVRFVPARGALSTIACRVIHQTISRAVFLERRRPRMAPLYDQDGEDRQLDETRPEHDPAELAHRRQMVRRLLRLMKRLPDQERRIIRRRFWKGQSLDAIGNELGVSRERVRQIEKRALTALRAGFRGMRKRPMDDFSFSW